MRTRILVIALLVLVAALWGDTVWEQNLAVRLGKNIEWQWQPVFQSRDGNNLLLWTTTESGRRDFKIAKLDDEGQRLWSSPVHTLFSAEPAAWPTRLVPRSESGYALLWSHQEHKSADIEPYLAGISEDGELLWQSVPLTQTGYLWTESLTVLALEDNRMAVVSSEYTNDTTNWLQVFEADGACQITQIVMPDSADASFITAVNQGDDIYLFYEALSSFWIICYNVQTGFVWNEPVACPVEGNQYYLEALAGPDGSIYCINKNNDLTLYRLDAQGQVMWSQALTLYNDNYIGGYVDNDGSAVVSWLQGNIISAAKYDASGAQLWPANLEALTIDGYCTQSLCCPDDNGGLFVLGTDYANDDYTSKLQHITSSCELEYGSNGQEIEGSSFNLGGIVNNGCFSCYDVLYGDDEAQLTMQTWEAGQQIVPTDARVIDSGVTGWSQLIGGGNLSDGQYYACWDEDRDNNGSYEVYLQTFDESGNVQLEENGHRMIELDSNSIYYAMHCASINGVIYLTSLEEGYVVVRLFTAQGEMHPTMPIMELGTYGNGYPQMTIASCGNYLSVLWYEHRYNTPSTMSMQRVNENGALWTVPFSMSFPVGYYVYPRLVGAYIVWGQHNYTDDDYATRAMLVINGQAAPGWPDDGLLIQGYNNYSDYNLTSVALQEEDLYLTQSIYNDQGFYDNYLCRVNNNTDMPFGSPGILVGQTTESYNAGKLVCNGDIYVALNEGGYLYAHRYTQEGEPVWGNDGLNYAIIPADAGVNSFELLQQGVFTCTWSNWTNTREGSDLYMSAFDAYGNLYTDINGELVADGRGDQNSEHLGWADGGFVAVWSDGRTSNITDYGEYSEIYAQRFELPIVSTKPNEQAVSSGISVSPNPFNPETTIFYSVRSAGRVELNVYNIRGQMVRTLVNEPLSAGSHEVVWNGRDDTGRACATGVYFCRVQSPKQTQTHKMLLLK